MKTHSDVSSSRRKARKAHFTAPSSIRRKILSCHLNADLKKQHGVRSIPVRKGDTVKIRRGNNKDREGKVHSVYRRRWCIYVDKISKELLTGKSVNTPIHPSNCEITALKLDKDRKKLLERKKAAAGDKQKEMQKMD